MKKISQNPARTLIVSLALGAAAIAAASGHRVARPAEADRRAVVAVSYPWVFKGGGKTSRETALRTSDEILRKAGYASVPRDVARSAWTSGGFMKPAFGHMPPRDALRAYGRALHAAIVLSGSVTWHTRSIWVDLGPKTISTATVDAYVFDVRSGKVVFHSKGVEGRSDEKEKTYKLVADVLLTPLVDAVSGGPATPREQRAVQIALARTLHKWARSGAATN